MKLIVDFNRIDKAGRIPALVPFEHMSDVVAGTRVDLTDGEGTHCRAVVDSVIGRIAHTIPEPGSFRYDEDAVMPVPASSSRH